MPMELTDDFVVPLAVADAWALLTNVERIAPCLPGARLDEIADGNFKGVVRVKVGPITVEYKGTATFAELDEANHKLVLKASGRETRGQGNASATVTGTLVGQGDSTKVDLHTDLDITGKVAQFGRGVLADVSSKLLGQFVKNLENDLIAAGTPTSSEGSDPTPTPEEVEIAAVEAEGDLGNGATAEDPPAPSIEGTSSTASAPPNPPPVASVRAAEPEPLNLVRLVGGSLGKKILPGVVLVFFAAIARKVRKRKH